VNDLDAGAPELFLVPNTEGTVGLMVDALVAYWQAEGVADDLDLESEREELARTMRAVLNSLRTAEERIDVP
jgi:hypothetical protein